MLKYLIYFSVTRNFFRFLFVLLIKQLNLKTIKLDTDKFLELFKPHYNDALRYCRALCAGKTIAEASDVLQQSFLQAIEKCDNLKEIDKFKSWFFKIITRCYFDAYRKNFWRRFQSIEKIESVRNIPDVFNFEKFNEDKLLLMNALSQISDKERAALLLFEIAGFSIEEIAQIQNENSISTVKSRLSRSRQKLKEIILKAESSLNSKYVKIPEIKLDDVETETIKVISIINTNKNGR